MLQHKVVGNLHGCLPLLVVYLVKHLISRRKGHDFGGGVGGDWTPVVFLFHLVPGSGAAMLI